MENKEIKDSQKELNQRDHQELIRAQGQLQTDQQPYKKDCILWMKEQLEKFKDKMTTTQKTQFQERITKDQRDPDEINVRQPSQDIFDFMKVFKQTNLSSKMIGFLEKQIKKYWNDFNENDKNQEQHFLLTKIFAFLLLAHFQLAIDLKSQLDDQNINSTAQNNEIIKPYAFIYEMVAQIKKHMKRIKSQYQLWHYKEKLYLILSFISDIQKRSPCHFILKNKAIISSISGLKLSEIKYLFKQKSTDTLDNENQNSELKNSTKENQLSNSQLQQSDSIQNLGKQQVLNVVENLKSQHQQEKLIKVNQVQNQEPVKSKAQSNDNPTQNQNEESKVNDQQGKENKDQQNQAFSVITQGFLTNNDISFPATDNEPNDSISHSNSRKLAISKSDRFQQVNQDKKDLSNSYQCTIEK